MKGERNRIYAATAMNHHSSRSHTVFRVNVKIKTTIPGEGRNAEFKLEGILNFVDLAGSERVDSL